MASDDKYIIREARGDEQSEIVSFLEKYYFPRETMNRMYLERNKHRIDEAEQKKIEEDIRNTFTIIVANVTCLVAVDKKSNKIVGCTLMLVEESPNFAGTTNADKSSPIQISSVTEMPLPFKSKILDEIATNVVTPAYNSVNLFEVFSSQSTALKVTFLTVDPEHCHHNLATRLINEIVKYAENKGIGFVYGLFTSPYSKKAAETNGFNRFSDVDILSFHDKDSNVIFEGEKSYLISMLAKQTHN